MAARTLTILRRCQQLVQHFCSGVGAKPIKCNVARRIRLRSSRRRKGLQPAGFEPPSVERSSQSCPKTVLWPCALVCCGAAGTSRTPFARSEHRVSGSAPLDPGHEHLSLPTQSALESAESSVGRPGHLDVASMFAPWISRL